MRKLLIPIVFIILIAGIIFYFYHSRDKDLVNNTVLSERDSSAESGTEISEDNSIEELYYKDVKDAPAFDLGQDFSEMNLSELNILYHEIPARKRFLFEDAETRGYFNGTEWYKPIWWDSAFTISYTPEEAAFMDNVKSRISELKKANIKKEGKNSGVSFDNIINQHQLTGIGPDFRQKISHNGFAIVKAGDEQLFHVYEQNSYDAMPSFVTTDLYAQLLHLHFDFLVRSMEMNGLKQKLAELSQGMYLQAAAYKAKDDTASRQAALFCKAYFGIPAFLLNNDSTLLKDKTIKAEVDKILSASGRGSRLLNDRYFDYTLFKPRGHYTRSPEMERYFKAMMWLQKAGLPGDSINAVEDLAFMASVLTTGKSKKAKPLLELYRSIMDPITYMVGEPDKTSVLDVADIVKKLKLPLAPAQLLQPDNTDILIAELKLREKARILSSNKGLVCFMPSRYTPDGEVLSRTINTKAPAYKRPFPKALDVFAAYGVNVAEEILLNETEDIQRWPELKDTIKKLQTQFKPRAASHSTIYNTVLNTTFQLFSENKAYPYFMQNKAWQRKNLNTGLAIYTELKHDMILYVEQPNAAEMGDGGEIPPPIIKGYVEPNVGYWQNSLQLLDKIEKLLTRYGYWVDEMRYKQASVKEIGTKLLTISKKELAGTQLSNDDYDYIEGIGGYVEIVTLDVLEAQEWFQVQGPEKSIALVADIFTNNDHKYDLYKCLEEGVGKANHIYVAVEIEGCLYLTKGGVFSYYEFVQPTSERLTDEAWQKMLDEGKTPELENWLLPIVAESGPKANPAFNKY